MIRELQTKDLFHFSRIMKKMDLKPALKGLFADVTGKKEEEKQEIKKDTAVMLALTVVENIDQAKNEVYSLLADLQGKKVDEIEIAPLKDTIQALQELFSQEEFMLFFKSAMQ